MEALHRLDMQAVLLLQFLGWFFITFVFRYVLVIVWRIMKGGNKWQ